MKTEKISVQKICMIAFAICINFVGGQIALFLKLPIYLDSIGTVFVAAVLGPFYGMLPNLLSGLLIVFAEPLYRLFTTDNQVVEIGVYMMRSRMPSSA